MCLLCYDLLYMLHCCATSPWLGPSKRCHMSIQSLVFTNQLPSTLWHLVPVFRCHITCLFLNLGFLSVLVSSLLEFVCWLSWFSQIFFLAVCFSTWNLVLLASLLPCIWVLNLTSIVMFSLFKNTKIYCIVIEKSLKYNKSYKCSILIYNCFENKLIVFNNFVL